MTKEERKEYGRKWREANKEKLKQKRIAYNKKNADKIAEQRKGYYKKNKNKMLEYSSKYQKENKDRCKELHKRYRDNVKLENVIVYCLPNEEVPYVGVTNCPTMRMANHKFNGRDTQDWFILRVCPTREEALELEAMYHSKGYGGANLSKGRKVA